jgi:DNA-binding transcriptional LysR family regulator
MVQDPLNGIAAFVQAVESGSFVEAAARMRLTRSAIGKSIARLEHRLGVRLFHRTTRTLNLTEEGQVYYERCVRALAELDAATAALDTGKGVPRGRLRMSAPTLFGRHCVTPVVLELADRYPELSVEMSFSDRVVDLVDEGFDLAVRIGTLPDSASLAARRLGHQRMAICAAPSYLAERGRPENLESLQAHRAIAYSRGGQIVPWRVRGEDQILEVRVESRIVFDDLQVIHDAAVSGAGLAWLPCWLVAPQVRTRELTLVMDSERVLSADIHAVWPKARYMPAKTRAAVDLLAARIPGMLSEPPGATEVARRHSGDLAKHLAEVSDVVESPAQGNLGDGAACKLRI